MFEVSSVPALPSALSIVSEPSSGCRARESEAGAFSPAPPGAPAIGTRSVGTGTLSALVVVGSFSLLLADFPHPRARSGISQIIRDMAGSIADLGAYARSCYPQAAGEKGSAA